MRNIRISIFMIMAILLCVGVVFVYSSSAIFSFETYGSSLFFLNRHLLHLLIGIILTVFVMSLDVYRIRKWIGPLFIFSTVLLIMVYVPDLSREVAGARRWLKIGAFSFQPSELARWATILFLADILSKRRFLVPFVALAGVCLLILMQPDLGGALTLAMVAMFLFFIAGMHLTHLISIFLLSLPVLWFSLFKVPYRRRRIMVFFNPWADARGSGFQLVQSYLALGLGSLWGVGLGHSRQKLFYLPAAHTDFIFSIIGEELGLIGTISVIALFMLLFWQGVKISLRSTDPFIQLLSFGIAASITLQAFVHIAVACGAVPTKGLPLPFVSYGGSSLVFNMMAIGLLLNCARERYFQEQKL